MKEIIQYFEGEAAKLRQLIKESEEVRNNPPTLLTVRCECDEDYESKMIGSAIDYYEGDRSAIDYGDAEVVDNDESHD